MYQYGRLHPRTTIAIAAALLLYTAPAAADDEQTIREPNHKLAARALARAETPETTEESWLRNIHIAKRHGFEYSHRFTLSPERNGVFNIQGPVVKKKTFGVVFEVRF
jgi:hypothetical protein